ncbi:MAG: hypothetical protein NZ850_00560, partial [Caldimicrobium sp.]|nr:hypothetical protein [Caldimicrobium sp.]
MVRELLQRGSFLVLLVVVVLLSYFMFMATGLRANEISYGERIDRNNGTNVTIESPVNAFNDTTRFVVGIYVENDTQEFLNLIISAPVGAHFNNATINGTALGVYFRGTFEGGPVRPLGNLTITQHGSINATAFGNNSGGAASNFIAGGVVFGNATSDTRVINEGSIYANATAVEGSAIAGGIFGLGLGGSSLEVGVYNNTGVISVYSTSYITNSSHEVIAGGIGNIVDYRVSATNETRNLLSNVTGIYNTGNMTVQSNANGTGSSWSEAIKVATQLKLENGGNFTGNLTAQVQEIKNEGRIEVSALGGGNTTARGVGVYVDYHGEQGSLLNGTLSASLGSFENTQLFRVISNSTGRDALSAGVYVGLDYYGGDLTGNFTGYLRNFRNNGTLEVIAETTGERASAYGVFVGVHNWSDRELADNFTVSSNIGNFTNEGNFTVTATGGSAEAYGLRAEGAISNFNNANTFSILSNASSGNARVYGVYVGSIGDFINTRTFAVTGLSISANATAYGMYAIGNVTKFENLAGGVFSVNATANQTARAYGLQAGNATTFMNNGTFEVLANGTQQAFAYGVNATSVGNFTNLSNFTVRAEATSGSASATGVSASNIGNFTNAGNFTVTATGGSAEAYGLRAEGAISNFNNTNTFSILSNATSGNARVYGVYVGSIGDFINTRTFAVTGLSTSGNATAYGVYATGNVTKFENLAAGVFSVNAAANQTARVYGLQAGNLTTFMNNGTFEVLANGTQQAIVYGVNATGVGNFTNLKTFTVRGLSTSGNATAYGVNAVGNVTNFNIAGRIFRVNAIANQTARAYGLQAGNVTGSFTNNGSIAVFANSTYRAYSYGIYAIDAGNFTNEGAFNVRSVVNATSSGESVAYGVSASRIGNLSNRGNFTVTANAINAQAKSYGFHGSNVGNFTNAGTFDVIANATNSSADARGVYGSNLGNFTNRGNFTVIANATGGYAEAAGVVARWGDLDNFTNAGNFTVRAEATGGDAWAYGAYAQHDLGNFTNRGNFTVTGLSTSGNATAYGVNAVGNVTNFNIAGRIFRVNAIANQTARAYG